MHKNIINFEMVNNKPKFSNVGTTAVNRLNDIARDGSYNDFGRFVKLLLCCEYVKHNRLKSRITKQQLRYAFNKAQRLNEMPHWVTILKGDKIIKEWDITDKMQLV